MRHGSADLEQVDDLSLVAAAVTGDQASARTFYRRHAGACYRLARARLRDAARAEDVVHDAFEQLWRQAAAGPMEGGRDGTLRGLLLTITHRRAIDVTRSAWVRRNEVVVEVPEMSDPDDTPDAHAELRDERERVRRAVQELDEPYRTVLVLDLAGHDNVEVAELTGRRPNTVAQQRRRALSRLREVLAADDRVLSLSASNTDSPSSRSTRRRSIGGGGGVA